MICQDSTNETKVQPACIVFDVKCILIISTLTEHVERENRRRWVHNIDIAAIQSMQSVYMRLTAMRARRYCPVITRCEMCSSRPTNRQRDDHFVPATTTNGAPQNQPTGERFSRSICRRQQGADVRFTVTRPSGRLLRMQAINLLIEQACPPVAALVHGTASSRRRRRSGSRSVVVAPTSSFP